MSQRNTTINLLLYAVNTPLQDYNSDAGIFVRSQSILNSKQFRKAHTFVIIFNHLGQGYIHNLIISCIISDTLAKL